MVGMRLTDGSRHSRRMLVIDLVMLPFFVIVGLGSHDEAQLTIFLRNAVPLEGAWLVTASVLGTYRTPSLARSALTWAIAVPAGLVVRTVVAARWGDPGMWVFFGVAMAFTLLFLAIGRLLGLFLDRVWGTA